MKLTAQALEAMVRPFLSTGVVPVYLARCCGRTYIGAAPAQKCRTCAKAVTNHEIRTIEAVAALAEQ